MSGLTRLGEEKHLMDREMQMPYSLRSIDSPASGRVLYSLRSIDSPVSCLNGLFVQRGIRLRRGFICGCIFEVMNNGW